MVADLNLPVKLGLVAVVALVAAAGLAAGIYYLARPADNPAQASGSPPPTQAAPAVSAPADARQAVSPPVAPVDAPTLPVAPAGPHRDAPPPSTPVDARQAPAPSTAPTPTNPPIPSPTPVPLAPITADWAAGPPTAEPDQAAAAPMRNAPSAGPALVAALPTSVPVPQTAGTAPDEQVRFTPDKEDLRYPNLGAHLNRLVATVESGRATSQQAAQGAAIHQDHSVAVTIHLSAHVDDVVAFLEDHGGDPRNVGVDYIEAYVPITLLGPVSELPGVTRVREIVPPQPAGPSGGPARP